MIENISVAVALGYELYGAGECNNSIEILILIQLFLRKYRILTVKTNKQGTTKTEGR
jgi:hypothetical protein